MEEQLSTRQAAAALKVSESSIKRWCDRGIIPTVRTVGGHRRIPLAGFLQFLEKSNRQVHIPLPAQRTELSAETNGGAPETQEAIRVRFRDALIAGDQDRCRQVLTNWYARTESFSCLADEFIAATFHQLGEKWDCGEIEVFQERRACEICLQVLNEFRRLIPEAPANAPVAIGGTPEGDNYSLPTQLTELVLRECHWRATNLGVNLPLKSLAAAVEEYKPQMVWLSVSHLVDRDAFVADYQAWAAELPPGVRVVVGGRALTDDLRPNLKYTGHCDNMQQLAEFSRAVYGG